MVPNSVSTERSLPSLSDNQAYLSLFDSDDEDAKPVEPSRNDLLQVKQEYADPSLEVWDPPRNVSPKADPAAGHAEEHRHGLPSPPISDPTPERERSRSVSVALISMIPAALREKFTLEPIEIKGKLQLHQI
jgi:hypothetical protein